MTDVLDPTYLATPDTSDLFIHKSRFMYSVLASCLMTSKSKKFLRMYDQTLDAQAVYSDLIAAYAQGTAADLAIESLERDIATMTLTDRWTGTVESFLDLWDHKVLDIEELRNDTVDGITKRRWLTAAIRTHPCLYDAITNAQTIEHTMLSIQGLTVSTGLTWDQFYNLVQGKAMVIDSFAKPKVARQGNNANTGQDSKQFKGKHVPPEV